MIVKEFNKYAKKFDLKEKNIMRKYHHSFRVMEIAKEIAISLELSPLDIELASICALFHDIGRFNQWTKYKTFLDRDSIDHGDESYNELIKEDFLKNYTNEIDIVLNAVKYHNKYDFPKLDKRTDLFIKIVRDADKLDIMREQCNEIKEDKIVLKKELLDDIYSKKICKDKYIYNSTDLIIRMLAWIFDLNFNYSFNFLKENEIILNKFNLLEMYGETEELNKLKKYIFEEIEKRII